MSFIDEIDNILIKAKEEAGKGVGSGTQTLERPENLQAENVEPEDESFEVALPSADELVIAQPLTLDPNVISQTVHSAVDPQNYIDAVSHAEDIEVRTNSLPEIKPAGKEFFFDNDEPVVF